jgi:hypothetical protein
MKATETFIKDAIGGGWDEMPFRLAPHSDFKALNVEKMLLAPLAWQAVGKTRRWEEYAETHYDLEPPHSWHYHWHRFIDHLADGDDIETALSKLV